MHFQLKKTTLALAAFLSPTIVFAQGVATDQQLAPQKVDQVEVAGQRPPLDPNLPASSASKSAEDMRVQQNIFNPEDALRNMPNTTVRKRYSGDRNALIGGRSFATSQAPRALVLMDGYLISNFLGRFDAPRWNMITPEEVSRVDLFYGPFSAIYPGNSIGTTVIYSLNKPRAFEASARIAAQFQNFEEYGLKGQYNNNQIAAYIGDRLGSGLWYAASFNRQDSTSQPQQYYGINANAAGVFTPITGTQPITTVNGVRYDVGPNGLRRAIFGANAGAIDDTLQHTGKLRVGYDFASNVSAEAIVSAWKNETATRNVTFLRDAGGGTVWAGRVRDATEGNTFTIPAATYGPFTRDESHLQSGVTVKTTHKTGWNASVVASIYKLAEDVQRTALNPDNVAFSAAPGAGIATTRDGTGFRTFEVQTAYRPAANDFGGGRHTLTFGFHANDYTLKQNLYSLADWRASPLTAKTQQLGGSTRLFALYGQDAWRIADRWVLTGGLRWESWKAYDGLQQFPPNAAVNYPERSITATSPKLSLAYAVNDDTTVRLSGGRGVRFATVSELFQGTQSGTAIVISDPNLKPERSNALELSVEHRFDRGGIRASLFQDDVRDTIWSQTNIAVVPNITNTQNIARVRTRGVELVGDLQNVSIKGLSFEGNIGFNDSKILENPTFLPSVGKNWVRVPRVRSSVTAIYQPNPQWSAAATYRYSGRQWNEITNIDINPDVYGGLSRVKQIDVKFRWVPRKNTEVALGIDNVADYRAFQSHPFPGRVYFAEVRAGF
jgi:iron complex outermembrane recepter protein